MLNFYSIDVVAAYNVVGLKKPAGSAEEIEKHFGCISSQLIMVNRNFTLLKDPSYYVLQLVIDNG